MHTTKQSRDIDIGRAGKNGVGVAFDIGTTTVAGAAVESAGGRLLSTSSSANPQSKWGLDVLSRIEALTREPELLEAMRAGIIASCNEIIRALTEPERVEEITMAGNPAMEHIFLGISPALLGVVPYKPAFKKAQRFMATDAGLVASPSARLYAFPLIGGFVGGDTVAAAMAVGMGAQEGVTLAVDIGTNSEMILSANGKLFATSAAAGPAFEGGGVSCGMRAEAGAVSGMAIEGDAVALDVIGETVPRGICGSGLIDAVGALVGAGVIDRTGRIRDKDEIDNDLAFKVRPEEEGNSFVLYRGASGTVSLTQADIRGLQTAKAAIRAGITVLLERAQLKPADVEKVFIAGAFGSNLKKDALSAIGLLDPCWLERITATGDAALEGAVLALSDDKKREAEEVAERTHYVPLSGSPGFESEFIKKMSFQGTAE